MRIRKSMISLGAVFALALAMVVPAARAGEQDEMTKFSFDQPLRVPGKVLPAGTYWFRIKDGYHAYNDVERNVISVWNENKSHEVVTLPAVPIQRRGEGYGTSMPVRSMDGITLRIADGVNGQPAALMTWFYPYGFTGHQFVYPSRERSRLDEQPSRELLLVAHHNSDGTLSAAVHTRPTKSSPAKQHKQNGRLVAKASFHQ